MNDVKVRSLLTDLSNSIRSMLLTILCCCCIYTGTVWVIGQVFVPAKAEGSLIYNVKGKVLGSHLIAQKFSKSEYLWSRPSAIDYNGQGSGGSNLSPTNPVLRERILQSIQSLGNGSKRPIPVDLVTASGSGLDPHISIQSANYQAERIASARGADVTVVREFIKRVSSQSSSFLGQTSLINVLETNMLLDQEFPIKKF